jgi:predicted RNase H-like HicB family nuclease
MPAKSKRSSRRIKPGAKVRTGKAAKGNSRKAGSGLDRPFAAGIAEKARKIVSDYQVIVECEQGHWYGRGLELPHVYGDGPTAAACIDDTRQALSAAVAYLLEQGTAPPTPAKQGKRTTQVNVRLTADEKAILESTARRKGFEGLSDFLRAAAMEAAS